MKHILLLLTFFLLYGHINAQKDHIAIAGKNGIFVHLGFDIPNGENTDFYIVERKTENSEWKSIAKIKFPETIQQFERDFNIYKQLFPYIKVSINTEEVYNNLKTITSIRDTNINKNISFMPVRLAAGNVFYDENIDKHVLYQYRVSAYKSGKIQMQNTSDIENFPGIASYSPIKTLLISRTDTSDYIKWWSVNGDNPYWVALYHYDGDNPKLDNYHVTHYSVGDTVYYFTEVKKSKFKQYFIVPFDYYGNQGKASQIAYVEKIEPAVNYFSDLNAVKNDNGLQIDLSWTLKNSDDILQINILRSEDFDGIFKKIAAVSNNVSKFTDVDIEPDKIYYYQLSAKLTFSDQDVKTTRFFGFGYEKLAPVPPQLEVISNNEKEVILKVSGSNERFIRGVRIYRKKKNTQDKPELISDLIPLKADTAIYIDTASIEGGYEYEYFAKSENTSHLESDFSYPVEVFSQKPIRFIPVSGLTSFIYNKQEVHLYWDNIIENEERIIAYSLYRRKDQGQWQRLLKKDSLFTLNRYVDKIPVAGNYEYKVCPVDFMFRDGNCSIIKVDIYKDQPLKAGPLTLIATDKGIYIKPSTIAIDNIVKYRIYKYQRGKTPKMIAELPKSSEDYMDSKVKKGRLYFYYITYVDTAGKESLPGKEAGMRY